MNRLNKLILISFCTLLVGVFGSCEMKTNNIPITVYYKDGNKEVLSVKCRLKSNRSVYKHDIKLSNGCLYLPFDFGEAKRCGVKRYTYSN